MKITKYKELEEERKVYMNECFRLHKLLKRYLSDPNKMPKIYS